MNRSALFALLAAALAATPALALQQELSRAELCSIADVVVIAEATSYEVVWDDGDDGAILTRVWLAPLKTVRGEEPETIELILPGGEIGDVRFTVEDTPERPTLDKRYLLFLRSGPDGAAKVLGGEAGAVRIADPGEDEGERYIEALASVGGCHAE